MATQASLDLVQYAYIAFYGRPADAAGQEYWADQLDANGGDLSAIIDTFSTAPEYEAQYGDLTNEDLVSALYQQILGRDADDAGLEYYVNELEAGNITKGGIALAILSGPLNNPEAADADDLAVLTNRKAVADAFTAAVEAGDKAYGDDQIPAAKTLLAAVGADTDPADVNVDGTVDSFPDATDPTAPSEPGETFQLTEGRDVVTGTENNDTFVSLPFDNQNTFQSGDMIDGGAGRDTLDITLGNSSAFAVLAQTQNVEVVSVRSQAVNTAGNTGDNEVGGSNIISGARNVVDAELMSGVEEWWSSNSRAGLIIEDVRSNSHETTVGFRNADAGDVDYAVYFDNQFITAADPFNEGAALFLRLLDLDGMRTDGLPLLNNPYDGFSFMLDGERKSIQSEAILNATTFTELRDAINAAFAADPELAGLEASLGNVYNAINSDTGVSYSGTEIVISNTGSGALGTGSWLTPTGEAPADTNILARQSDVQPETIEPITSVNIVLDNVGRGSKSGDLEIGAMSQSNYSGSRGIEQFDIEVDRSSWINTLQSTNNTLEVVNVENIGANGSVRIDKLNDVRVFDASAMLGDVTLTADLSAAVVGKYMQLEDAQANPAEDNIAFNYSTGAGNDSITLDISSANLANDTFVSNVGTTTREDFDLNISTGAGDDYVELTIVNDDGDAAVSTGGTANWYQNSSLNSNLQINTGDGNDTIWTPGSGNVAINAGAGDDTIYVDNTGEYRITGRKATFVFNQNTSLTNPLSDTVETYRVFNGTLTVTFKGYEVEVALPHTNGVVSDLQVNQAIKDAINGDDVLNKLLVAKDSAANGLVVESLIDGEMDVEDLSIELSAPTSLTPAEVAQLNQFYNQPNLTDTQLIALMNNDITAFETRGDYDTTFAQLGGNPYAGLDSTHTSDNTIIAGAGDDVVVLGTGAFSNDTLVYDGTFNNGVDTIVNFNTDNTTVTATVGVPPAPESFTVTFADLEITNIGDPTTVEFDDSGVINLNNAVPNSSLIPAADVAYAFAQNYAGSNWDVEYVEGTSEVTFVAASNGDLAPNITAAHFVFTNTSAGDGGVVLSDYVDGQDAYQAAVAQEFTVDFNGTIITANGTLDLSGLDGSPAGTTEVDYTVGDGPITLAANVAAASYANWTAVDNLDGTVTFTATETGPVDAAIDEASELNTLFGHSTDGITATSTIVETGRDQEGDATLVTGVGLDYIDFSAYGVEAVYVNGVLEAGTAPNDANHLYVEMTEETDNAGEYLMEVYEAGADGVYGGGDDVLVGVIGSADFGTDVQGNGFVTENFII